MEFLFELGLEEIPARMIASAQAELERRLVALLERERLSLPGVAVKSFSTPRRLAVWIGDVAERQGDLSEELLGPSAKIAYKDGAPTSAALAFAKKAGVPVEELKTVSTPKGEYLQATAIRPGRPAVEVLAAELPKELAALYWAKNMYWRAGRPERFVRPVRWLLALLGPAVVPVEFAGFTAANLTYGHRVLHGAKPIEIHAPAAYERSLKSAFVLADVELRRHTIRKALDRVCRGIPHTRWREDHALVDKLTHLTEWPSVLAGNFDPEFLALPEEVLVTVMRDHQSYFAVEDKEGKLAPYFLTVLNTQADAPGEGVIRHGNEHVLRARFNDARFFWEFDQRVPLVDRVSLLAKVTFQKDLGSYAAKTERVRRLAASLGALVAEQGAAIDLAALDQAALLAKTDLTCELVKEFTELQGVVGGLYAKSQGESSRTADAIYDQYLPQSMEDAIPRTIEGAILAIADKADTIAGMYMLGLEPTGSKDPFALRRAANGIVKILAEFMPQIPLKLITDLITRTATASTDNRSVIMLKLIFLLKDRLSFYLTTQNYSYDVVNAVLFSGSDDVRPDDIRDTVARASAITQMRTSEDFMAVCGAFNRINGILTQASERQLDVGEFHPSYASETENALWLAVNQTASGFASDCDSGNYISALQKLATLRPVIDRYFESVMVMTADLKVRAHRLGTLQRFKASFIRIADFSLIVTPG